MLRRLLQCNRRATNMGIVMKALLTAAAVVLALSAVAPVARAEGPRPSSENNWAGMTNPDAVSGYQYPTYQFEPQPGGAPHYEWQEGYEHGGKWHGHWVLVQ
jgi:hypothetical protein